MDKRIAWYGSFQAMQADEYRAWQRLPGSERSRAVMAPDLALRALPGQAAQAPRRTGQGN
jgi:hypothetical protein